MSQQFDMYRELTNLLDSFGVKNPEELLKDDLYLGYLQDVKPYHKMMADSIEVECKVISTKILDDECHSLVKLD